MVRPRARLVEIAPERVSGGRGLRTILVSVMRGTDYGPHGPEYEILMIGSGIQAVRLAHGEAAGHSFPFLNSPCVSNLGQFGERQGYSMGSQETAWSTSRSRIRPRSLSPTS
jgi:hypothetical protein